MKITHADLVAYAVKILKSNFGCSVVCFEQRSLSAEIPDAIGWRGDVSIVIECKTSRSDFLADVKKPFRLSGGVGKWRFYLAPEGVLNDSDMPEGWRLLRICGNDVKGLPKGNVWFGGESVNHVDLKSERDLLLAMIRGKKWT